MNEENKNKSPWAEKLDSVQLPDEDSSWDNMKASLDKQMPTGSRRNWWLWSLLLLLVPVVCNCPGMLSRFEDKPSIHSRIDNNISKKQEQKERKLSNYHINEVESSPSGENDREKKVQDNRQETDDIKEPA